MVNQQTMDKLAQFKRADAPLPKGNILWPLYGAGLENLGVDGKPIEVPMPAYGPDELLIRHDACGLCFSDTKVIAQGQNHPRITRDMKSEPVVLGHEVSMTVVGVGENLRDQYYVGQRLTLETDIVYKGVPLAYGYMLQGGLSQYSVIDKRILESDDGNFIIPVDPEHGYAEIALTEPWACVVAAYNLDYRTQLKPNGSTWIIGAGGDLLYTISSGFDRFSHPARVFLTNAPANLASWIRNRAIELGVEVIVVDNPDALPVQLVDDIIILGGNAELIEKVSPHLDHYGTLAIMATTPLDRKVNVDVGRVHYHRWNYVGSTGADIAGAYQDVPVRSNLKVGGKTLFVGAGGPMGRMHVQRSVEFSNPPATVVCSDISDMRLNELIISFAADAQANQVEFICVNPLNKEAYSAAMARFEPEGFDDVVVMAPVPAVISDSFTHLGQNGVMNVFAGVARGTMASLDLSDIYLKNVRVIGHSGSWMRDMQLVLDKTDSHELSPNRTVAAVGSLIAAHDGLKAVKDATLAGKVVIYPHIKEMPLTPIMDLKDSLPSVYALFKDGREWTNQAEEEFLRLMLP